MPQNLQSIYVLDFYLAKIFHAWIGFLLISKHIYLKKSVKAFKIYTFTVLSNFERFNTL